MGKPIRVGWGPLVNGPAADPGFDWLGVVVRHWLVGGHRHPGKRGRNLYRCVSRCGVVSVFRADDLARGATRTCEACRGGVAVPPPARVLAEAAAEKLRTLLEKQMIAEKSNLKGKEAVSDWEEFGRPCLAAAVRATGLGLDFGWQAFVRDCHERAKPRGEAVVRAKSYHPGQRRVELMIRPEGGRYSFEVDLTTGRTDVPYADVQKKIHAALEPAGRNGTAPANGTGAVVPAPEPAAEPAGAAGVLGGMNLDRLAKLRDGMDAILAVGRDVASTAELKRDAAARVAASRDRAAPLREAVEAAAAVADRARAAADEAQERAARLNRELAAAVADRDRLSAEAEAQAGARDRAIAAYAPARDALSAAEAELADIERLEADRVRSLAKADDIGALLLALQKLAG